MNLAKEKPPRGQVFHCFNSKRVGVRIKQRKRSGQFEYENEDFET